MKAHVFVMIMLTNPVLAFAEMDQFEALQKFRASNYDAVSQQTDTITSQQPTEVTLAEIEHSQRLEAQGSNFNSSERAQLKALLEADKSNSKHASLTQAEQAELKKRAIKSPTKLQKLMSAEQAVSDQSESAALQAEIRPFVSTADGLRD